MNAQTLMRTGLLTASFLLLGGCFVAFAVYLAWGETLDDAAISSAYAKNLAHGHGLVLSPGADHVEAYSNFLWVLITAPVAAVGLDLILSAKLLGLLFSLAALFLLARVPGMAMQRPMDWLDLLAPTLTSVAVPFALWSVSGMENALESFLLVLAVALSMRELNDEQAPPWSSLAFVALALTRPEGIVFWFAAGGHRLFLALIGRRRARLDLAWVASFLVPLAIYHAWHYQYFGELVPNTYYAKASDRSLVDVFSYATSPSDPGFSYIRSFLSSYWLLPPLPVIDALFVGPRGLTGAALLVLIPFLALPLVGRRGLTHYSLPLAMLLAGTGAVLFDGGDWMPHFRFMSPLIPLWYLSTQESIRTASLGVSRRLARSDVSVARAVVALALAGVVLSAAVWSSVDKAELAHDLPFFAPYSSVKERAERVEQIAQCLGNERASVLTPDIGAIAFKTDLLVIDVLGLADAYIARDDPTPGELADYLFNERRPDLIASHTSVFGLDADPRWQRDYVPAVVERDRFGNLAEVIFVRRALAEGKEHCLRVPS